VEHESLTDWLCLLCKSFVNLYWSARSNVFLGDFRKPDSVWIHACQWVDATAARGFTVRPASRNAPISDRQEVPVHPTLGECRQLPLCFLWLLIMCIGRAQPARHDLGSLHFYHNCHECELIWTCEGFTTTYKVFLFKNMANKSKAFQSFFKI
jgi:hypothetical protein